jgi:hypothetical protein
MWIKAAKPAATVLLCLCISVFSAACSEGVDSQEGGSGKMASPAKEREPAVAGQFYPKSEQALRKEVTGLLRGARPPAVGGRVVGLIAPHAGYMFSGDVAAHAYSLVQGNSYDAVIVVAPSHHLHFQGSSIYTQGPYRTPLGLATVDADLGRALIEQDEYIGFTAQAHAREHSLEVQVPFLQIAVPGLKIVPIVMGDQSLDNCRRLARAIAAVVKGRNVLLVASTDLSHFHTYDEAVRLDSMVIESVERYDYERLARDLEARKCEACGGGPTITVMLAARELGATRSVILKYANSGDIIGDRSSVVGYLAAALVEERRAGVDLGLRQAEKAELLRIARQSIEAAVLGKPVPDVDTDSDVLKRKMGAFVTITKSGQLRGCIGHIRGIEPLFSTVSKMGIAAATEDPRFEPVTAEELDTIALEITVLTPFREVEEPEEIEVGRDGIYIEKGSRHGLLLPQVATEYGWGRDEFLDHTCMKAGLPPGAWKEGARIYAFSGQVFNEQEVFGRAPRQTPGQ